MGREMRNRRGRKERQRRQRGACATRPQMCDQSPKIGIDRAAATMRRARDEAGARSYKIDRRTRRVDQRYRARAKLRDRPRERVGKLPDRGHRAQIDALSREPRGGWRQDRKVEKILADVYPGKGDIIAEGDDTGSGVCTAPPLR